MTPTGIMKVNSSKERQSVSIDVHPSSLKYAIPYLGKGSDKADLQVNKKVGERMQAMGGQAQSSGSFGR